MALNANNSKNSGSKFDRPDPLDPGAYPARLVQVVDLGLQPQRPYKGEEKEPAYMINTTYEFLDEFLIDKETGEEDLKKPRWLSEDFPLYTLDSDRAKSTKRYLALDPDIEFGGDWKKVLGNPVIVTLVQNKSKNKDIVYENIKETSTMRPKEANKAPELVNKPKFFDLDDPDVDVFMSLPKYLQDKIKGNLEFEGSLLEKLLDGYRKEDDQDKDEDDETEETDGEW